MKEGLNKGGSRSKSLARSVLERRAYPENAGQTVLKKFAAINDRVVPAFVQRETFVEKGNALHPRKDEKITVYFPKDAKITDLPQITDLLRFETPEGVSSRKVSKLSSVAIYLAKETSRFGDTGLLSGARDRAEATALDLYQFGERIQGRDPQEISIGDLAAKKLSTEQQESLDQAFGIAKVHKTFRSGDTREEVRRDVVARFFTLAGEEEHRDMVTHVVEKYLKPGIEEPREVLEEILLTRGDRKLREFGRDGWSDEIRKRFRENLDDFVGTEQDLREVLNFPSLCAELDAVRKTHDISAISAKEREVALKVQQVVSALPYSRQNVGFPTRSVARQDINCLGATRIGGDLLREAGIKYLVAGMPKHSLTLLVTSDGKIYLQDFLNPQSNSEQLTGAENAQFQQQVIALSNGKSNEVIKIFKGESSKGEYFHIYPPGVGEKVQTLINASSILWSEKKYEAAIWGYEKTFEIDPDLPEQLGCLACLYAIVGRYQEAIAAFKKGNAIAPGSEGLNDNLVHLLKILGKEPEKLTKWRQAVGNNPTFFTIYVDASSAFYFQALAYKNEAKEAKKPYPRRRARKKAKEALEKEIYLREEMLSIDSENMILAKELYKDLTQRGKHEHAAKIADKIIAFYENKIIKGPNNIEAYEELEYQFDLMGMKEQQKQLWDKIITLYQEKIESTPDDISLYYRLAPYLSFANRHEEAIPVCQKIIASREKKHSVAWYPRLAVHLTAVGREREALAAYQFIIDNVDYKDDYLYKLAQSGIARILEKTRASDEQKN